MILELLYFLKGKHLLKVSTLVAASWNEITAKTLWLSWRKILPGAFENDSQEDRVQEYSDEHSTDQFDSLFHMLGQVLTEDETEDWLQVDEHDTGYEHLTDGDIISGVLEEPLQKDSGDDYDGVQVTPSVPDSAAMKMFDGCLQWLQEQEEASVYNITALRELRELAAK